MFLSRAGNGKPDIERSIEFILHILTLMNYK